MMSGSTGIFNNGNDPEGDEEDDDISLNSTLISDVDPEQTYIVNCILGEKQDPSGKTIYLVRWEGYPIERATWEPPTSFDNKEIIKDFLRKKSLPGGPQQFDWKKWDRDREKQEKEKLHRKIARQKKRARLGFTTSPSINRSSRRSSAVSSASTRQTNSAVGADTIEIKDSGPSVSDSDDTENSENPLALRRRRKNAKKQSIVVGYEDDFRSDPYPSDSMVEELVERSKNTTKGKVKQLLRSREAKKETEQSMLHARARKISAGRPAISKKRARSITPPDGNTARQLGPQAITTLKTFRNISEAHRVYTRGRQEPAPDVDALNLFQPGIGPAKKALSRAVSEKLTRPNLLTYSENHEAPSFDTSSVEKALDNPATGNESIRKRKRFDLPTSRVTSENLVEPLSQKMIQTRKPYTPKIAAIDSLWGDNSYISGQIEDVMMPNAIAASLNSSPTRQQHILECEVEYGPADKSMGMVRFIGFKDEFLTMIIACPVQKLRISRALENEFIRQYLYPAFGAPYEFVDLETTGDFEPVITALTIIHGAGIVLHENFTLLLFQPTNDTLRKLFLAPQQKQRTALRAVAYPPLEDTLLAMQKSTSMREPLEYGLNHYLPNLLHRFLGMNCLEMLKLDKKKIPAGALCVVYAPRASRPEQYELENTLKLLGHKVGSYEQAPEYEKQWPITKERIAVRIFVHHSLNRQLHILPHLDIFRFKARDVAFYFFGTKFVQNASHGMIQSFAVRFWVFGTLILVTPDLVIKNPHVLHAIINYQQKKAGSTWICTPSTLVSRIEKYEMSAESIYPTEEMNSIMKAVWDLEDRKKYGEVIDLRVENILDINEFELIIDNFIHYQLENCSRFRRFVVVHSSEEITATIKARLYSCVGTLAGNSPPAYLLRLSSIAQKVL